MSAPLPRLIEPESVERFDKITVKYPDVDGVVVEKTGVVYRRIDEGSARYLYTAEGGCLLVWYRGSGAPSVIVTLRDRPPATQEPLPIFEHVREQIA